MMLMAPRDDARVVVGVDGTPDSEAATAWALQEALLRAAGLHLVHAVPTSGGRPTPGEAEEDQRLREAGMRLLDRLVRDVTAAAPGVAVTSRLAEAPAYEALLQETDGALLLALGARGTSQLPQLPIGSVPVHLTAMAPCPVVVVRANASPPSDPGSGAAGQASVVVGVDVDPRTDPAFGFAVDEATLRGATLVVVRAMPDDATGAKLPAAAYLAEAEQRERQRLAQWLTPWQDKDRGIGVRPVLVRAHPVAALLQESVGAALLVVGSHGGGVAKGILLGSVSQALMRGATCPSRWSGDSHRRGHRSVPPVDRRESYGMKPATWPRQVRNCLGYAVPAPAPRASR